MRTKKSNWPIYVIGAAIIAAFIFVLVRENPFKTETVEQPIPVSLEQI